MEKLGLGDARQILAMLKGEQVKVTDDEIASLLRPIKRFYNYTDFKLGGIINGKYKC